MSHNNDTPINAINQEDQGVAILEYWNRKQVLHALYIQFLPSCLPMYVRECT